MILPIKDLIRILRINIELSCQFHLQYLRYINKGRKIGNRQITVCSNLLKLMIISNYRKSIGYGVSEYYVNLAIKYYKIHT